MAFTDLHVNGPARVDLALSGGASYTNLGFTLDGVNVEPEEGHEDIFDDNGGPFMPSDVQLMGAMATIRMELVRWDRATLSSVLGFARGQAEGAWSSNMTGTLLFAGSKYIGVRYQASQRSNLAVELAKTFPYCHLIGSVPHKVGTRITRYNLTFRALMVDGVLYTQA